MSLNEETGLTVLGFRDYPVTPWKNGQGVTRDIFMSGADGTQFDWRLSLADVGQSGDFSDFSGYERTITLLDGDGFLLDFEDGSRKELNRIHQPFVFDGGAPLRCQLYGGPSRDLNLMVRRDRAGARVGIREISGALEFELDGSFIHLFFCLRGSLQVTENNDRSRNMGKWDCAKYEGLNSTLLFKAGEPAKLFHMEISLY